MPKHCKACGRGMARGGMARGGVPAAGVGSTVGQWVEDWVLGWLGFADGGEVPSKSEIIQAVNELSESEQNKLVKEAKKDLLEAVKDGEVKLPAGAPAAGVGSTVGQWVEDWVLGWLGFEEGGMVPHRARGGFQDGGMIPSRSNGGHSVFY